MHNLFFSSCPVARRSTESFVQRTMIGGKRRRFEFMREIVWLQESEAVVRFVHGGEELKRGSTHTDFYGYLSAAEGLIDDAERAAKEYSVSAASSLVIEIASRVFQQPVIEPDEARKHNLAKPGNRKSQWAYLPDNWRKEVMVEGETLCPRLERVELGESVIWSSKESPEGNEALLSDFKARWRVTSSGATPVAEQVE